jgi:hypothetical protein
MSWILYITLLWSQITTPSHVALQAFSGMIACKFHMLSPAHSEYDTIILQTGCWFYK